MRLSLFRVDGAVQTIDIGLTAPTRDVAHIARLIDLKLERLAATQDADFGFEASALPSRPIRAHGMPQQAASELGPADVTFSHGGAQDDDT